MLKDITLGQFFPGDTIAHRLDPRTKLLALILYIVTIFIADGLIPYVICAAGLVAVIRISRIPLKLILKSLKPIVIIIIFTGALNILYTPGTELFRLLLRDMPDGRITVNSAPCGLPFYRALGFRATDNEQTVNGIRFTPMEYRSGAAQAD